MFPVNKLLFLLAATIFMCFKPTQGNYFKTGISRWIVQKSSTLKINGSSNVNKFQCGIEGYYQTDTISFNPIVPNSIVPLKGALIINVLDLDCKNRIITKDLRRTLKAEDYPNLVIRFIALERMPVFGKENTDKIKGCVEIELAGTCKRFDIPFVLYRTGNSSIELNGARDFSFADFRLIPPKKIGGLVKVNDKFNVNFNLVLNQLVK